ncbi:hypothetical protein JST97_02765 [bacterium]|nr:hypothetical protein [bacterium]
MTWGFGIYGYEFSHPADIRGVKLVPLPNSAQRGQSDEMLLTGYGLLPAGLDESYLEATTNIVSWLADAMTFCQQRWVMFSKFHRVEDENEIAERVPDEIPLIRGRPAGGSIIVSDGIAKQSRLTFFELFIEEMSQNGEGGLAMALYRQLEISRLSNRYWELEHFLAFSGLEILARSYAPSERDNKNVAVPLTKLLTEHGFRVPRKDAPKGNPKWSNVPQDVIEDFAAARNMAFHRGIGESIAPGSKRPVNAIHQIFSLKMLLADLSLRLLQFDDGWINWDRWGDRVPFGQRAV